MFGGISKIFSICKYSFYELKSRKQWIAPDDPVSHYCFSAISWNSLIHSLHIDLHRYILHYFHIRYSCLCCSVRIPTDLHQKLPTSFPKDRFDFVLHTFTNRNNQLRQFSSSRAFRALLTRLTAAPNTSTSFSFARRLGSNFLNCSKVVLLLYHFLGLVHWQFLSKLSVLLLLFWNLFLVCYTNRDTPLQVLIAARGVWNAKQEA